MWILLPGFVEKIRSPENSPHIFRNILHFQLQNVSSRDEDDSAWQQILHECSECFIKQPSCTVSVNSPFVEPSGTDHPALCIGIGRIQCFRSQIKHDDGWTDLFLPIFPDPGKFTFQCQTVLFTGCLLQWNTPISPAASASTEIRQGFRRTWSLSGGSSQSKSLSAFSSAALENFATAAGCHSGAETAFVRFFDSGRLEGSLHEVFPFSGWPEYIYGCDFNFRNEMSW